jgi:hypothetical protein
VTQIVSLIVLAVMAPFLLLAPDRHFRPGTRRLRVVGAVASSIAVAAIVVDMLAA